jgi:SAM-dependent methyltransferase
MSESQMLDAQIPELPGDDLIFRVAGTDNREWFWKSGQKSVAGINSILSNFGKSISDFPRALDFGCGCGRMMLHLQDVGKTVELYGVDIDPEAIAWAQEHIPWATLSVNQGLPPLDFPDEYFDLIFNHSVFTHIDENYQDAWLVELERVTKPGGTLVLSASGDYVFEMFEKQMVKANADPAPLRGILRDKGILFIAEDGMAKGVFPDFYHTTFHSPWYIFERWGSIFDIKAYIVRGDLDYQDLLLLQRREQRVGTVPPAGDLATELRSARARIAELELSVDKCEQEMQASKREFTNVINSRSWRITAPMRRFMEGLRQK